MMGFEWVAAAAGLAAALLVMLRLSLDPGGAVVVALAGGALMVAGADWLGLQAHLGTMPIAGAALPLAHAAAGAILALAFWRVRIRH